MGNDGTGWSNTIYPRYTPRDGQDDPHPNKKPFQKGKRKPKTKMSAFRIIFDKPSAAGVRSDPEKFAASLERAIGKKAARQYLRRQQKGRSKDGG